MSRALSESPLDSDHVRTDVGTDTVVKSARAIALRKLAGIVRNANALTALVTMALYDLFVQEKTAPWPLRKPPAPRYELPAWQAKHEQLAAAQVRLLLAMAAREDKNFDDPHNIYFKMRGGASGDPGRAAARIARDALVARLSIAQSHATDMDDPLFAMRRGLNDLHLADNSWASTDLDSYAATLVGTESASDLFRLSVRALNAEAKSWEQATAQTPRAARQRESLEARWEREKAWTVEVLPEGVPVAVSTNGALTEVPALPLVVVYTAQGGKRRWRAWLKARNWLPGHHYSRTNITGDDAYTEVGVAPLRARPSEVVLYWIEERALSGKGRWRTVRSMEWAVRSAGREDVYVEVRPGFWEYQPIGHPTWDMIPLEYHHYDERAPTLKELHETYNAAPAKHLSYRAERAMQVLQDAAHGGLPIVVVPHHTGPDDPDHLPTYRLVPVTERVIHNTLPAGTPPDRFRMISEQTVPLVLGDLYRRHASRIECGLENVGEYHLPPAIHSGDPGPMPDRYGEAPPPWRDLRPVFRRIGQTLYDAAREHHPALPPLVLV